MSAFVTPSNDSSFLSPQDGTKETKNNGEVGLSFGSIPSFSSRSSLRQDKSWAGGTPQLWAQTVPPLWSHAGQAGCMAPASRQAQAQTRLSDSQRYLGTWVPLGVRTQG